MNTNSFKYIILLGVIFSLISFGFAANEFDFSEMAAWVSAITWSMLFYFELKSNRK
jgi:hypothetical protein